MQIIEISVKQLMEAPWNPNQMDEATMTRLRRSLQRFGLVQNLVVHPIGENKYEVLSGNQRLRILREMGTSPIPCCVVEVDQTRAKLIAQALNRIHGEDDPVLKAEVVRDLLKVLSEEEIMSVLPDTKLNLTGLANLGQETLANCLENWEKARSSRLRNLQFRLTQDQLEFVQRVLSKFLVKASHFPADNPNNRGNALYLLCKNYLEGGENE